MRTLSCCLKVFVFERQSNKERKRESSVCWFTPTWLQRLGLDQAAARTRNSFCVSHMAMGPKHLGNHPLLSQVHSLGTGSEQHVGLQLVLRSGMLVLQEAAITAPASVLYSHRQCLGTLGLGECCHCTRLNTVLSQTVPGHPWAWGLGANGLWKLRHDTLP